MDRDRKTLKFQMMMSPGEAAVLDDWMFRSRVRSRAEAIRRLVQIGLAHSEIASPAGERIRSAQDEAMEPVPATGQPPVGAGSHLSFIDNEDRSGEAA